MESEQLKGLLTADEDATAMMAQLRKLKEVPVPGEVLSFSTAGLLMDPKFSSVYIRGCYKPLFEELLTSRCKDIIITGTPGIGKSWFLYYMLARLLALPQPPPYILWQHLSEPTEMLCYDHSTGKVWSGTRQMFKAQLQNPNAWYISDGVKPRHTARARIILITSPTRSIYKEMLKSGAIDLYMPLWTLKELLDCRAKVYAGSVSQYLAMRLYKHYGGVARYVLGVPSQRDTQGMDVLLEPLKQGLAECNTAQVRQGIGALETGPEVSHRVLHIITKGKGKMFEKSHLDFASQWVADAFVEKAMKDDFAALVDLVAGTSGSLRGHLHEQLMHRLLPQGGSFTAVPIDRDTLVRGKAEEKLLLPTSKSRSFKTVAEISAADFPKEVYFRPLQTNFATVDSLLRVDDTVHMFQMTVAASGKAVSAKALTRLFDSLLRVEDKELDLRLYYVVLPDIFESFKLGGDSGSWPPGKEQPDASRTSLFVLKGGAEACLPQQQTKQAGGTSSSTRSRSTAAARRRQPPPPPAAMMYTAAVGRSAAAHSGRARRFGGLQLAIWRW